MSTEDTTDLSAREETILKTPLAMGLLGHSSGSVYAQMEISFRDYETLDFVIKREAYSNLPDVEFSINSMDLEDIIDILKEAKRKLDKHWLSTQHPKRDAIYDQHQSQKEGIENEEVLAVRPRENKEKGSAKCAHYLGYLASHPVDLPLPQECVNCPKVFDCSIK